MTGEHKYWVLAYYLFTPIGDPHFEVKKHKQFFDGRDVSGRIYLSEAGINGQMSGDKPDVEAYMEWLKSDSRFASVVFKIHYADENIFPRMTVKYRKQLAALDCDVDASQGGEHVSPAEWRRMMEEEDDTIMIDVRNQYEWEVGRFEGAELPECETFREFPEYTRDLKERVDPKKTKVMMYCTGGIRCEMYSAQMKNEGFENVYQLDGGVIGYGQAEGNKHWEGKLFVFDDRLTTPISDDPHSVIGSCHHCETSVDNYYNCANMDCNRLFLCCADCLDQHLGCCQDSCCDAERVRPYQKGEDYKPFRRLSQTQSAS